jgi:hypothetical protein
VAFRLEMVSEVLRMVAIDSSNFSIELTPHLNLEVTTHKRSGAAISRLAKDVIMREMGRFTFEQF